MIRVENIRKIYNKFTNEIILNDVSLTIPRGKFVSIIGESGSGKSTLLNILGTLDNEFEGKLYYDDIDITSSSNNKIQKIRSEYSGFVFQDYMLIEELNVYENVRAALIESKLNRMEQDKLTVEVLKQLKIYEQRDQLPNALSGGQQQRVSIARAIVKKPKVLFCDEPTGALDYENSKNIINILTSLNNSGLTIVMVTHNIDYAKMSDICIEIQSGKIKNTSENLSQTNVSTI